MLCYWCISRSLIYFFQKWFSPLQTTQILQKTSRWLLMCYSPHLLLTSLAPALLPSTPPNSTTLACLRSSRARSDPCHSYSCSATWWTCTWTACCVCWASVVTSWRSRCYSGINGVTLTACCCRRWRPPTWCSWRTWCSTWCCAPSTLTPARCRRTMTSSPTWWRLCCRWAGPRRRWPSGSWWWWRWIGTSWYRIRSAASVGAPWVTHGVQWLWRQW